MLKIDLLCVGNLKEKYLLDAVKEYSKRLSGYCTLNIVEHKEARTIEEEGFNLSKSIPPKAYKVALDLRGRELSSEAFAKKIEDLTIRGVSRIVFIIGGSEGLSKEIKDSCHYSLSFSKMTFPHQLMRVIFLEQIYRAFKILKNEPYHK